MLNAFFAIVSGDDMYISKIAGKAAQSVGTASIAFGNQASASKSVFGDATFASPGWYTTAVPEPTSGLLLLLGMAGLALKRKRA